MNTINYEKNVLILYATFTGNTQLAAEFLSKSLKDKFGDINFQLSSIWDIKNSQKLQDYQAIIFGLSTWGDGANPDTERFIGSLVRQRISLFPINIALFGLGDSAYENFCGALHTVKQAILKLKGQVYKKEYTLDGFPTPKKLKTLQLWAQEFLQEIK